MAEFVNVSGAGATNIDVSQNKTINIYSFTPLLSAKVHLNYSLLMRLLIFATLIFLLVLLLFDVSIVSFILLYLISLGVWFLFAGATTEPFFAYNEGFLFGKKPFVRAYGDIEKAISYHNLLVDVYLKEQRLRVVFETKSDKIEFLSLLHQAGCNVESVFRFFDMPGVKRFFLTK